MRWTHVLAVGAVASLGLTAACSAPASTPGAASEMRPSQTADSKAAAAIDPTAKGPAPEVAGAKRLARSPFRTPPLRRTWTRAPSSTGLGRS